MTTRLQAAADRRAAAARRELAEQLVRLCADAGITHQALAETAGVARSYVGRILAGEASPSLETYQRLASALGADLSGRLYPNTGPAIRDRHQARILELLLGHAHPRWRPYTEVAVRRPARGFIDVVFHEPREATLVATEIQGDLRRLEQLVRWSAEKAASLPSWDGYAHLGGEPRVSRLLVVRRTRTTRQVARELASQLRVAYPAHPDDALTALAGTGQWPGAALVWATLEGDRPRFLPGR